MTGKVRLLEAPQKIRNYQTKIRCIRYVMLDDDALDTEEVLLHFTVKYCHKGKANKSEWVDYETKEWKYLRKSPVQALAPYTAGSLNLYIYILF